MNDPIAPYDPRFELRSASSPVRDLSSQARDLLWTTYRWMAVGLAVTGLVAWYIAASPAASAAILQNHVLFYGLLIGQFVMVMAFTPIAQRASSVTAAAMFVTYSALVGATFSVLFFIYTRGSIAQTFFVSGGTFAALSLYGATTKRDLTGVGRFMMFGLVGIVIASVVNIFMNNPAIYWVSTYAGVLVFAGLTAYDTQKLQNIYASGNGGRNVALVGALTLYLDFINLFLMLLRLTGRRR